ncbi:MAG: PIN domain-containing protein [Acidobacteria bacterium]|nr:PIN domain-containing protein [Acidobacteriota bacterium]
MILETNALSAKLDSTLRAVEVVSDSRELAISVIVAEEFALGIAQSRYREAYQKSIARMLDRCRVLDIGIATARHYAAIRLGLKAACSPIAANDIWIATLSRQYAIPVMSRDSHFDFVGGLRRRTWQ